MSHLLVFTALLSEPRKIVGVWNEQLYHCVTTSFGSRRAGLHLHPVLHDEQGRRGAAGQHSNDSA